MFERFTEKAVQVIMLAQQESLSSGHNYVAPEQLLLGIMGAEDGLSFSALKNSGLTLDLVRSEVIRLVPFGSDVVVKAIPFTESAKRALELSWDEARKLDHRHIGTEHLLLGLLRERHSVAEKAMENLGVDTTRLQQHVHALIKETDSSPAASDTLENDKNAEVLGFVDELVLGLGFVDELGIPEGLVAKGKEETIGRIKWAAYETATSRLLSNGEKILSTSDVVIKPIVRQKLYDKRIELGDHFNFGLVDSSDKHGEGFGLSGLRDDEKTFSWDWFVVDHPGHAHKLQESGELSFDRKKTPNGTEINRMEFLTDVSIRVSRRTDPNPLDPAWRIKIFKGSVISWPALVNGEVH